MTKNPKCIFFKIIEIKTFYERPDPELEKCFPGDVFPNEKITEQQIAAYESFVENKDKIFKEAFDKYKEYCLKNYSDLVDKEFKNIFSYLIPKDLYVRREKDDKHIVGIICNFRFDKENQLVAYVENENVTCIGTQDIIM